MRFERSAWLGGLVFASLTVTTTAVGVGERQIAAVGAGEVREWDTYIGRLQQEGALRAEPTRPDTLMPERQHLRLTQLYRGVPVFGAQLVRQSADSEVLSIFGTLYDDIAIDTRPAFSAERATALLGRLGARPYGSQGQPQLFVLPRQDGSYALTWKVRALLPSGDIRLYFVDAQSGDVALEFSDRKAQSAVGTGTGVLDDRKKVSARNASGGFVTDDGLRPPQIRTYDFKGDLNRLFFINGPSDFLASDLARDSDNTWTDGAVVDAHVYAGYTYDYYYKRFGRRGLDNANIPIISVVHPVNRSDRFNYPSDIVGSFFTNAFYAGDGLMVYGEGLTPGQTAGGKSWNFVAGALDVVAHELTHGVTDYSSGLIYQNQSGALNESFSDMMGTSVEFFFQPAGSGPLKADYLIAEDVVTPGGLRSMQNPAAYGDPDHFSLRFTGTQDNGGVHTNSGIPNHAFYLAIEGGTNRVSGLSVAGVGAANREQIERIFYRAFVFMLPPNATFSTARAATIQAARDLYGVGSAPERAVTQAWTAVGVL